MPDPEPFHVVFVEPDASHVALTQLLVFEGFAVTAVAGDDLSRKDGLCADLLVLNHGRLRQGTLPLARAAVSARIAPLTVALVRQGDELTGVELVERGVDAYIAHPCGTREFVARIRAMLRRARPGATMSGSALAPPTLLRSVRLSGLDIDPARRRVRLGGHDLRLTEQEFQLLYFLAGHPGRVFDRQALLDAVWGSGTFVTMRSVDALVKRLRHQLRVHQGDRFVETVRGVGYRLVASRRAAMTAA